MGFLDKRFAAGWFVGAWVALIVFCATFVDYPLSRFAHDVLQRPRACVWLTWIGDVPAPAATFILVLSGGACLAGWRPRGIGRVVLAACLATLAAVAAKDVLKFVFGRPWPETWVDRNPSWIGTHVSGFFPLHGGRGFAAFPSGHTTAIAAPCAVLWRDVTALRPAAIALPVLTAAGLVGADFHFLSDCLAGALLGAGSGWGTRCLVTAPAAHDAPRNAWNI